MQIQLPEFAIPTGFKRRFTLFAPSRDALLVICLVLAWLLPGLFGREPWKADEAYTFGLINHIVQTGDWVVPTLAGEPFMEKPPIYFITAAIFGKLFGGWLPLHDAARLANVFYLGIAAWALSVAAASTGVRRLDVTLALFGTLALAVPAHYLMTDIALLAGTAMGLAGLTLSASRWREGSLWLGLGGALAFLAKGLLGPGILGITALLLPIVAPAWRTRSHVLCCSVASLIALPLLGIWLIALWQRSPALFHVWLWDNNFGRFTGKARLGPQPDSGGYLNYFGHGALPLWPLLLLGAQNWRKSWRTPSALLLGVGVAILSLSAEARVVYILPLLPAMALLTIALPDTFAGWQWVIRIVAATTIALVAFLWVGTLQLDGIIPKDASYSLLSRWMSLPADVVPVLNDSRYWLAGLALVVLFPWLVCPGAVGRSAFLRSWAAAMAIIWSSGILLLLPWLAAGNDYRQVMTEIEIQIQQKPSECLLSSGLGEPQRALLEYYAGIQTQRLERAGPSRNCQELLVQSRFSCKALTEDRPGWQVFWHGGRPGGNECFSLYQKPVS